MVVESRAWIAVRGRGGRRAHVAGTGLSDERGQSVLEFLLMLPMMIGLVVILIKVNTVIQISIVNQQYARAQALWLAFNSPVYPQLRLRQDNMVSDRKQYNQMVIGVSENPAPARGEYTPKAATFSVARRKGTFPGDNEDKQEPKTRALVRVRDTVTLCTQPNVVRGAGGGLMPILELQALGDDAFVPKAPYRLGESTRFDYCSSPMSYAEPSGGES